MLTPSLIVEEDNDKKPFLTLNCNLDDPSSKTICGSVLPTLP
jgi:hypothetical protein